MKTKFIKTDEQYNRGFMVGEFNGEINLTAAREYQDKIFERWGDIETGKDKTKKMPVQIGLGSDPRKAVAFLKRAIALIESMNSGQPEDNPPFQ